MRKVRLIGILCLIVAFIIPLAIGCGPQQVPPGQAIKLVFSTHDPDTNSMVVGIYKPWFAMIEQKTGGKVKFEMHYNGELLGPPQAYDGVIKGIVDMDTVMIHATPDFEMEQIITSPLVAHPASFSGFIQL